jgi:hypothetical protein
MTYKENLEIIYKDVILLAVTTYRKHQSITLDEAIEWINKRHPELLSPYKGFNGVIQAAYNRAQDEEAQKAIKTVFTHYDGTPVWEK